MPGPEVSDVHQSEGEAEEGTPLPRRGQPESRVFGSSLSCGNVCRASPWLWRLRETQVQMKATHSRSHWLTRVLMQTGRPGARRGRETHSLCLGARALESGHRGKQPWLPAAMGGKGSTQTPAPAYLLSAPQPLLSSTCTAFQKHTPSPGTLPHQ